jgi:hypothetical protein
MASIHETIVTVIRETAIAVNPTGRFIYGDDVFQTLDYPNASKASDIDAKALISLFTFDWTSPKESDSNFNSAALSMGFLRSSDPQDRAEDVEGIINEMSAISETFFSLLENAQSPLNYTISAVTYGQTRGVFQGYYTGVLARVTFSPLKDCVLPSLGGLQNILQSLLQS